MSLSHALSLSVTFHDNMPEAFVQFYLYLAFLFISCINLFCLNFEDSIAAHCHCVLCYEK